MLLLKRNNTYIFTVQSVCPDTNHYMDPISAFGVAAGVLQVVAFSTKLLSVGHQLYQDGSTVQNSDFVLVVDDLSSLNDKIKSWARPDPTLAGPLAKDNQASLHIRSCLMMF
jgi:hypothetical protein